MKKISTLLSLCLLLSISLCAQDKIYLHVINVGQGSAMLVEFPCSVALIDTGGESNELFQSTDALMNYLDQFFARRTDLNNTIDLLMISHPHIDHTRGAREVAAKYRIKNLVTNAETKKGSGIGGQVALQTLAANAEGTATTADDIGFYASVAGNISSGGITNSIIDPINCPGANPVIKLLWGTVTSNPGWSADAFSNQNNHSIVSKIEFGAASIMLTGDMEDVALATLLTKHSQATFDSDVYLVGHHGSKNGTTLPFLQAVTPEIAILSFGDKARELSWTGWAYGHPNKEIVTMLESKVSGTRARKNVFIGTNAKTFTSKTISKAVYGVGWDDSFILTADLQGNWTYGLTPSGPTIADTRIDLNVATEEQLQTLPSIGVTKARAIVSHRATNRFDTIDELDDVEGIGPATINLIRSLVKI